MKRMPGGGYTIIEVMIFLVVSAALLTSAMTMISGKEERTRFTTTVTTFDQKMKDILNDVSNGYYPSANGVTCITGAGNTITLSSAASEQGTQSCLFLGKAIQLDANSGSYNVYTIAGQKNATSLADANAKLMGFGGNAGPFESNTLPADILIMKVVSLDPAHSAPKGIALVSEFSTTDPVTDTESGNAANTALFEIPTSFSNAGTPLMVPSTKGILLCLQQGAGGRKAYMKIGADGQRFGTETKVVDDWPAGC